MKVKIIMSPLKETKTSINELDYWLLPINRIVNTIQVVCKANTIEIHIDILLKSINILKEKLGRFGENDNNITFTKVRTF